MIKRIKPKTLASLSRIRILTPYKLQFIHHKSPSVLIFHGNQISSLNRTTPQYASIFFGKQTTEEVQKQLHKEAKILIDKALEILHQQHIIEQFFGTINVDKLDEEKYETHYKKTRLEVEISSKDHPDRKGVMKITGIVSGTEPEDIKITGIKVIYKDNEIFRY